MDLRVDIIVISLLNFAAAFMCVRHGWPFVRELLARQEAWYQRVLVEQLVLDVNPKLAVAMSVSADLLAAFFGYALVESVLVALFFAGLAALGPYLVIRHLEQKRLVRLDHQLVDGITLIASGVRAGLNLVQSMELVVTNGEGPIRQEFAQMMREYQMGLDLNQAMRNASDRIGSRHYRLVFTAIEMHRRRGGDSGESLDRIAESIREIQRLEGKLDALTSQGKFQAWAMAAFPPIFLVMLYFMDPEGQMLLYTEPLGRVLLLIGTGMIVLAFFWIRKILTVDI